MAEGTLSRLNALDRNQDDHLDLKQSIKNQFLSSSYCIEMTRSPTRGRKQKLIYTSGVNFRTGSNLSSREGGATRAFRVDQVRLVDIQTFIVYEDSPRNERSLPREGTASLLTAFDDMTVPYVQHKSRANLYKVSFVLPVA